MSAALPVPREPRAADVAALEAELASRLEPLTDKQRAFVEAFARVGEATEAARQAGYSDHSAGDIAKRLKRHPQVSAAIRAAVALREATADLTQAGAITMLERMLRTRLDDLLVMNANGAPVEVRDWESLGTWQQRSVKKLHARVRRSAKGERAHVVSIEVELVNPLEVLDRLARLRGWYGDSPNFELNLGLLDARPAARTETAPLVYDLADAVLGDEELERFLGTDDDAEKRRLLRDAIRGLRAIPARAGEVEHS